MSLAEVRIDSSIRDWPFKVRQVGACLGAEITELPHDDLVALRSALRQLRAEVTTAVDQGAVSGTQWDNLRDAVLRPALGLPSTTPTRRNGSRARQALAPYLEHAVGFA